MRKKTPKKLSHKLKTDHSNTATKKMLNTYGIVSYNSPQSNSSKMNSKG